MDAPITMHREVVMLNDEPYDAKRVVAQRDASQNGFGVANTIACSCLDFPPTLTGCAKKFPQLSNEFAQQEAKLHQSARHQLQNGSSQVWKNSSERY